MTNEIISLLALLKKASDSDFLHKMFNFTTQRLMALEIDTLTGAEPGTRTP